MTTEKSNKGLKAAIIILGIIAFGMAVIIAIITIEYGRLEREALTALQAACADYTRSLNDFTNAPPQTATETARLINECSDHYIEMAQSIKK